MNKYHKIQGLYKRDMNKNSPNYSKFILGQYSIPEFELLKDIKWVWTEKIDGTNIRVCIYPLNEGIGFQGRTDKAEIPNHLLNKLKEIFTKDKIFSLFVSNEEMENLDICLYGEGYGYKIQSGSKYMKDPKEVDFILFDVKIGNVWLKRESVEEIAKKLNLKIVPVVGEGTIDESIAFVKKGSKSTFGDFIAEGLVIRPKYELKDRMDRRIITKIKYKDFI